MEWEIILFKRISSTNDLAKKLGKNREALVVVADSQTSGRGRYGRKWESPPGENLYLSVSIKEKVKLHASGIMTLISSVSVCETLDAYGIASRIKWPNDVYVRNKKICGILNEVVPGRNGYISFLVLGIGLNVNSSFKGTPLEKTATSMKEETSKIFDRMDVLFRLLDNLQKNLSLFRKTGPAKVVEEWFKRLRDEDRKVISVDLGPDMKLTIKVGDRMDSGEGGLFVCSWE